MVLRKGFIIEKQGLLILEKRARDKWKRFEKKLSIIMLKISLISMRQDTIRRHRQNKG
jgi:hypothetical protein